MPTRDWFRTAHSRDDLARIFLQRANAQTITALTHQDIAAWGRCRLAHELELLDK